MLRPEPGAFRFAVDGIRLAPDHLPQHLPLRAAERLGVPLERILHWRVLRRSLDARGLRRPCWEYRIGVELSPGPVDHSRTRPWPEPPTNPRPLERVPACRPLVVGAGPAGLFAALRLCAYGVPPLLVERGEPVQLRVRTVARYWRRGELDPDSNVQFGEGGAGAFSDGKLTYRGKDPRRSWVLDQLVAAGAPPEVRYEARPHLGTDRLRGILVELRHRLYAAGCEIRFRARVDDLELASGRVAGVRIGHEVLSASPVFLAPGHSARELLARLITRGVAASPKGFALGVRVQLAQTAVARAQYGRWADDPALPAAEFAVKTRTAAGRDVYSFCMCPGGVVIPAGTEVDGLVLNGMSGASRSGRFANAALVVGIEPADFGHDPLAGHAMQRRWERAARDQAGEHRVPGQRARDFVAGRVGPDLDRSNCPWPVVPAVLDRCLPDFAAAALRAALPRLIQQLPPLAEGLLLGVETRTSSPLRLERGSDFQSISTPGLFPLGEGAGYAGGIVSSALDGVAAVDAWLADGRSHTEEPC